MLRARHRPTTPDPVPEVPGRRIGRMASDGRVKLSTALYRRQHVPMFLSAAKSIADRDTNVNTTVAPR